MKKQSFRPVRLRAFTVSADVAPVQRHPVKGLPANIIGLREILQETMVFTIKYRAFL